MHIQDRNKFNNTNNYAEIGRNGTSGETNIECNL
jgi:hypothetical protein